MRHQFLAWFIWAPVVVLLESCDSNVHFSGGVKKSYDAAASQVFNFTTSSVVDGSVSVTDGGRYTSFEVTQSEKPSSKVIQRQNRRQSYSENFIQGHPAKFSKEEFQLTEAGMLDFLVVIDDSKSMADEQEMVATGLAALTSEFKDTNWQIAVISTSDPCVSASNLIKKGEVNADKKFASAVKKPWDRQATEQGFPMAIQALKGQCNGAIRNWVRSGSTIGVMILSDEDNCGSDPGEQDRCRNITGKNAAEMVSFLRGIRSADDARMYAIVDKDGTCPDAGGIGRMYVDAVTQTGGTLGSICHDFTQASGYAEYLKSVSKDVNRILKRQFMLSSVPDLSQFDVAVDGQPVSSNGVLSIRGNIVTIDPLQIKDGMKITFSYTHDAVPMFNEVPVAATPDFNSIELSVNGALLKFGQDFSFDSARRVLVFSTQPPNDAKVALRYTDDTPLLTHFPVNLSGLRPDTLKVTVNGLEQAAQAFSADANGIDFALPPANAAIIQVSWKTDSHKNLEYAARISDQRPVVAWVARDKNTGADVPAQWANGRLVFTPENVLEGRVIVVEMDFGAKAQVRVVSLPDERIDDEIKILADGQDQVCAEVVEEKKEKEEDKNDSNSSVSLIDKDEDHGKDEKGKSEWKSRYKGREVTLRCKDGVEYTKLEISYKHEVERTTQFKVPLPESQDPDDPTLGWKVYIDGHPTQDFKRDGAMVELEDDQLPPETKIDIEVITYTKYTK